MPTEVFVPAESSQVESLTRVSVITGIVDA